MCFYLPTQSSVSVLLQQAKKKKTVLFYLSYFTYKQNQFHSVDRAWQHLVHTTSASLHFKNQEDFWTIYREDVLL